MSAEGAEFLEELKRLADPEDLPALLKACRGQRITFGRGERFYSTNNSWIKKAIGEEKADKLVRRFAAESWVFGDIEVPMAEGGSYLRSRLSAHERFVDAVRAGKTNNEIARLFEITRRAVVMRKQRLRRNGVDLSRYDQDGSQGAVE